jgi:tRNA U34 2-thiouridine synthase MnmA/TrmU
VLIKKNHKPIKRKSNLKALSVFSGGLDSILASELIRNQGIEVVAICFETPFFSSHRAKISAASMGLPLKVMDISERHLEIVKNPKYGHGGNMNPCIDCHALMFRIAGEMLPIEKAKFIISGEVLGQRPMSQNRKALSLVAVESGMKGLLLRPLSAKLLPLTIPEKEGWVDREQLMGFSGRSRKPQMKLAQEYQIDDYPSPAGGCLLTDMVFSKRLKDLLTENINPTKNAIELLKTGRHFRLDSHTKIVVGRNQAENQVILSRAQENDLILDTVSVPGPTVLLSGEKTEDLEQLAAVIAVSYSDAKDDELSEVVVREHNKEKTIKIKGKDKKEFKKLMI